MSTQINSYIEANKDRFLNELLDLLRIPSISADPKYKADVLRTADAVKEKLVSFDNPANSGFGDYRQAMLLAKPVQHRL